jgi:hypothetical protein
MEVRMAIKYAKEMVRKGPCAVATIKQFQVGNNIDAAVPCGLNQIKAGPA